MVTIKNVQKVESLEEAWKLNQQRNNRVLGGMLWIRLGKGNVQTAIDLSGLGLDQIEETKDNFRIGCMTTLRQMEQHEGLSAYTQGAMKEALRHIVGVQFRNLATVGGSVYGRFGFSDVCTILLALDSYVELYQGGMIPMKTFLEMPYDRDLLVAVHIRKTPLHISYQHVRNTQTDFPVLTCAVTRYQDGDRVQAAIGARPGRAVLIEDGEQLAAGQWTPEKADAFADYVARQVATGTNTRGTAEYRTHLIKVLTSRALKEASCR